MNKFLFHPTYLKKLVNRSGWNCCHMCELGSEVTLFAPIITSRADRVTVVYPIRCHCGKTALLHFDFSLLYFGYLLARSTLFATAHKHLKGELALGVMGIETMTPAECERSFGAALAQPSSPAIRVGDTPIGPLDFERAQFRMSEAEWQDFCRRLGFAQNPPGNSSTDSEP